MMVGTIMNANFLNLVVVKFVKFLNNIGLACIVMKTSQTLEIKSIDYPPTFPSVVNWRIFKNSKQNTHIKRTLSLLIQIIQNLIITFVLNFFEEEIKLKENSLFKIKFII